MTGDQFMTVLIRDWRLLMLAATLAFAGVAEAGGIEPIQLSLVPVQPVGTDSCCTVPSPAAGNGRQGKRPVEESEHRPLAVREYWYNSRNDLADVRAYVRRPDGSVIEVEPSLKSAPGITFKTPLGEGPAHGPHNVYVVEQGVKDGELLIRSAKWITMHHSCGWGHDHKFDEQRIVPQALDSIPFEIVIAGLWDDNFHSKIMSGDNLTIRVLSSGRPVKGARVTLATEKNWQKTVVTNADGIATLQLIRDYYAAGWSNFDRTRRGDFIVTATYETDQAGEFNGRPYERIQYAASLPWHYSPASRDYSSYSFGLLIGTLAMTVSGVGVYAYRERRKKPFKMTSLDE